MGQDNGSDTRFDQWLRRAKNNPLLAVILLVGVIVGALASFTDSLQKISSLLRRESVTPTALPAIRSFRINPEKIRAGDVATIEWNVDSAESATISGDIGPVPLSGRHDIAPQKTTTYTLTATSHGANASATATIDVATTTNFDGALLLSDVFAGNGGWELPTDAVFRSEIGGGRFHAEWTENRSAQCISRPVSIGADEDFSIQVKANLTADVGYALGLCWGDAARQATYMLYVYPGSSGGIYYFVRDEVWQQTAADGQLHPYGHSVNLLDPNDVNHRFPSSAIRQGLAPNVLTVIRTDDKLRVYINDEYVTQVAYPPKPIARVGMFISGQLAADFREFSVRKAQ